MPDGMGREFAYLSSHATNRYFIPNWGMICNLDIAKIELSYCINVNVGEIFVLLSDNIVILKYLIMLIFNKL